MEALKNTPYWNVWGDCCQLHKSFFGITEEDTARWEQLLEEAGKVRNKYKNTLEGIFAEKMLLLVAAELEGRAKKGESENAKKKQ